MFAPFAARKARFLRTVAFAALAGAPSIACADSFKANYSITLIGIPLGTAGLVGTVDGDGYRIDANAKLTGIAAMVSSSKGAAASSGIFAQGRVAPNSYATTSANASMTRTVRIAMNAGNVKAAEIAPPFDEQPGRVPVTEAHKHGIADPLSALIMPVPQGEQLVGPAACNRSIPVYDGWTRFNVNLSYVGTREVKTRGYQGPVAVCAARYVAVAGHRPDKPSTKFMEDNRQMEVWLAPVGSTRVLMPYRISVMTMVGTTVIEAQAFETTSAKAASR